MTHARMVRLEEVATFMGGSTPSRNNPAYFGGDVPWVKTTDLNNGLIVRTEETLTDFGLANSSCKIVPPGAVLVAMYGGFNQIGRTGLLSMPSAINQALTAVLPNPKQLDPNFLIEWLNFRVDYWRRFAGSSRKDPNITKGDIADFPVPLISVELQQASIEILRDWNSAIEQTQRLIAAKEAYIGAMTARIYRRSPGWSRYRLGDFLQETKVLHGHGDYVIGSVGKNGIKPRDEVYSKNLTSNHERNLLVKPGWLCFGLASDCMAFGVNSTNQTYSVSPAYRTFQINGADPRFFEGYLRVFNGRLSKRFLITSARQGKAIDFEGLFNTECYFPSREEQQQIASAVLLMREELDHLRQLREALKRQKRGLMQKLLTGEWRVPVTEVEVA